MKFVLFKSKRMKQEQIILDNSNNKPHKMEQTIREKVKSTLEENGFGLYQGEYLDKNKSNCVDQIMQLIPQWRTFSETDKPEVEQWILVSRGDHGSVRYFQWSEWSERKNLKRLINQGYQFFIIPKNKNQKQ